MTTPTEIEALEEALTDFRKTIDDAVYVDVNNITFADCMIDLSQAILINSQAMEYLQLLKGEHETMVIVPRELTPAMLTALDDSMDVPELPMNELDIADYRKSHKAMIEASEKENQNE